jgi:ABC-type Fe3+/spermidine/putrescine transport system ATPase subunit
MGILRVVGLSKSYREVKALNHVSFDFPGGILSILGPSGCGKTTLLRCIAGLEIPDEGTIEINGKVQTSTKEGVFVPPYSREIGFVFQNYALWPHMSVRDNIAFGLKLRKLPSEEVERRVRQALELVGLGPLGGRYPSQLSGGQQQRVALARSLALEPSLILLDEPLSNLDAKLREEMRLELKKLIRKVGISAVYVTHDQEEAFVLSDRVIVMERGEILQYATPEEIYSVPANPFVAGFIGRSLIVSGEIVRVDGERCAVRVPELGDATLVCRAPNGAAPGLSCHIVIRTSEVPLSSRPFPAKENVLQGVLRGRELRGGWIDHRVQVGSREVVVTAHRNCPMVDLDSRSETVFLQFSPATLSAIVGGGAGATAPA